MAPFSLGLHTLAPLVGCHIPLRKACPITGLHALSDTTGSSPTWNLNSVAPCPSLRFHTLLGIMGPSLEGHFPLIASFLFKEFHPISGSMYPLVGPCGTTLLGSDLFLRGARCIPGLHVLPRRVPLSLVPLPLVSLPLERSSPPTWGSVLSRAPYPRLRCTMPPRSRFPPSWAPHSPCVPLLAFMFH